METSVIRATEDRFRNEPSAAQSVPAVRAALANGRARISAGPFNWDSDLPHGLGGGNLAPSPTAYLLGALAGFAVAFIHDTLAPQLGIAVDDVAAEASCRGDARGLLAMDGVAADLTDISLRISIKSTEADERIEVLRQAWLERCPIYLAIGQANPVAVELVTQRGSEQPTARQRAS